MRAATSSRSARALRNGDRAARISRRHQASILSAILKEEPETPSSLRKEIPHELERIVTQCLRKDPERRFQHMDDVRVALEKVKEERPRH